MSTLAVREITYLVGDRPIHRHKCLEDNGHIWECNSPYCEFLEILCPAHGGTMPVTQGREPWRGR